MCVRPVRRLPLERTPEGTFVIIPEIAPWSAGYLKE